MCIRVYKQVLGLYVSVADTEGVNISQGSEGLVGVELDEDDGHLLLQLVVVLQDAEHRLGHVVHHHVQVDLVRLVALRVEGMLQRDDVGVVEFFHDLQLAVLVALVLVDLLDGDLLVVLVDCRLEDDAEGAIA
eukprot:CAMPEP_0170495270 /NCGR_PEP_ID=MMETSP0208-20121228/15111_1 /TAXON_ID=197538 /ORGANISM="Strombidium inclinatum, Strain S3" /LENGTH=132 /DNA_ID=CAMNT_0010771433 /DNA_START=616 /DNA_END=1011 /DNA_ORIENTATION=-